MLGTAHQYEDPLNRRISATRLLLDLELVITQRVVATLIRCYDRTCGEIKPGPAPEILKPVDLAASEWEPREKCVESFDTYPRYVSLRWLNRHPATICLPIAR